MSRALQRSFLLVAAVVLVPGAFGSTQASSGPGAVGPYVVGHTSYTLINNNDAGRPVYVSVWYPARQPVSSSIPAQYPLDPYSAYLPVSTSSDWEPLGYDAAYEGAAPSPEGPFPLLVFSPGFGDDYWEYLFLGTRLASHGYVVAVTEPYTDCEWPWTACEDLVTVMVHRSRDVSVVVAEPLAKNMARGSILGGLVDPERIAVGGHSIGGYGAYALAGGDDSVCDAPLAPPGPAETCIPVPPDHRIKAMISLDGSSWAMSYQELARISIPSLIMGQTVDNLESVGADMRDMSARPHAAIGRLDSYRVDLNGSNHYSFTNYCDGLDVWYKLEVITYQQLHLLQRTWPCAGIGFNPVTISSADAHLLVSTYVVAFLDAHLGVREADRLSGMRVLTEAYALEQQSRVQFFEAETCPAPVNDDLHFSYRPYQVSSECDAGSRTHRSLVSRSVTGLRYSKLGQRPSKRTSQGRFH